MLGDVDIVLFVCEAGRFTLDDAKVLALLQGDEMKGKPVVLGTQGSGITVLGRTVLRALDIAVEEITLQKAEDGPPMLADGREWLDAAEATAFLTCYGIPVARTEAVADAAALLLGVGDALEGGEEPVPGGCHVEVRLEDPLEGFANGLDLALAEQAVIDENAGQLVADCAMRERRRHRRIHPAAQRADHPRPADLLPDLPHRRVDIGLHRPRGLTAADVVDKVAQDRCAFRRVGDLGMKLETVDPALVVVPFHCRNRRVARVRDGPKSGRHALDAIAVRHPHDGRPALPDSFEQIARVVDREIRPAILAVLRFGDLSAGQMRHELHSVTNAENRNALIEQFLRNGRRLLFVDARRPPRQHDPLRTIRENRRERRRARQNLRVDLRFPDAAGDQLGVLRSEVENQNSIVPEFHEISFQPSAFSSQCLTTRKSPQPCLRQDLSRGGNDSCRAES